MLGEIRIVTLLNGSQREKITAVGKSSQEAETKEPERGF